MQTRPDRAQTYASASRLAISGALLVLLLFVVYVEVIRTREYTMFLTTALADSDVRTNVEWRGTLYRVERGVIEGAEGPADTAPILALAYKRALAERAPLLGLPGEDIMKMRASVRELEEAQDALAASATAGDARAIQALYPIDFLSRLVDAEEARRVFMRSGSDAAGARYDAALEAALSAHMRDLRRFGAAFSRSVQNDDISYAVTDALVSKAAIQSALQRLAMNSGETRALARARRACVRGDTDACDPHDIRIPRVDAAGPVPIDAADVGMAREIRQLLSGAFDIPDMANAPMVALSRSACAHGFPGAPIFTMSTSYIMGAAVPAPYMLGDARFLRTDAAPTPLLQYLASEGVEYLWYPSLTHYKCLRLQSDTSSILGTLGVRTLALDSPLSTHAQDAALASVLRDLEVSIAGNAVVQESDAVQYLSLGAELYGDLPDALFERVLTLTLQFKYRTGGLADTMMKIALIEKANLELSRRGVPTDLSVPRLFFSESGFISLFLADNGSLIPDPVDLMPVNALSSYEEPYVYYSNIVTSSDTLRELTDGVEYFSRLYR